MALCLGYEPNQTHTNLTELQVNYRKELIAELQQLITLVLLQLLFTINTKQERIVFLNGQTWMKKDEW